MGLFMASLLFILLLFSLPWAGAALRLVSDIPEMVLGNIGHQLFTQKAKFCKGATPFCSYIHTIACRGGIVGIACDYHCPCASDGIDVVVGQCASPATIIDGS